jgi:hypothetical protein
MKDLLSVVSLWSIRAILPEAPEKQLIVYAQWPHRSEKHEETEHGKNHYADKRSGQDCDGEETHGESWC